MDRWTILRIGRALLSAFCVLSILCFLFYIPGYLGLYRNFWMPGLLQSAAFWISLTIPAIAIDALFFWTGILMVYLTSYQLGIRHRVLGVVLGLIPIANIIELVFIIGIVSEEIQVEKKKKKMNRSRREEKICATRYPILLVHGVFFRDFKHLNYWGRIPAELEANGAKIYYGEHMSAASVDICAGELTERIRQIIAETGCEKVNVIAHSKGGLDTRTAISCCGAAPMIASLTTINTPHRGCEFADYLLFRIPEKEQKKIAATYNAAAAHLGDPDPDFLAAVYDLTFENCSKRNERVLDSPDVFYQSIGSIQTRRSSGRFPLNLTYPLVRFFDGPNDGLVGEKSFPWGSRYMKMETAGLRGISHADIIDLNRENLSGFDVREFYVQLVADLKDRGY